MEQAISEQKSASIGKKTLMILGTVLLLGFLGAVLVNMMSLESTELQNRAAPEFTLALFDQFDQEQISLSELQGQVVVINFWASWCVECYKEAELLEQTWRGYQDKGVMFLGVAYLDTRKESLAYMQKYDITYPSGPDLGSKISDVYGITGVPETIFIDKNGNIAHVQIGPIERDTIYRLLDELIAQPAQGT